MLCSLVGRMELTQSLNAGAHGHIHELMGGTWSKEWNGFVNRTEEIVLPFAHAVVVSKDDAEHLYWRQ